jgi:Lambda phage tail tube protein, TTP
MASTAISAQGTKLYIAGTAGGSKTLSAAASGNPTIITSTAHGFQNGDYITIAGVTTTTAMNGAWVVKNRTANSFAIDFDSTGLTPGMASVTATAAAWTQIKNLTAAKGIDGSAKEIDVTNHDSTAVEILLGLQDNGQFSVTVDGDNADAGQVACQTARADGAIRTFKYVLPAGSLPTATFTGFVKKFDVDATINDKFKRSLDIRISGAVTFS